MKYHSSIDCRFVFCVRFGQRAVDDSSFFVSSAQTRLPWSEMTCRLMPRVPLRQLPVGSELITRTVPFIVELLLIVFPPFRTQISLPPVASATRSMSVPISGGRGIGGLFLPLRKYP